MFLSLPKSRPVYFLLCNHLTAMFPQSSSYLFKYEWECVSVTWLQYQESYNFLSPSVTRQRQTRWFTSGLSLTRVLSWISAKPIVYRLFSILNSDLIHNNLCFYNVWIYSRSHSATRIIRAACYRKFYFDFPSPLLAYSPLAKPARVPLTQLNPYFTHAYTHLTLFHCYLLKWQIRVYLCVQVRTRSSCIRHSWSWRLWRHGSASCLGNRPSWGNG